MRPTQPNKVESMVEGKLTDLELNALHYAERNHGRNYVTALEGEPHNAAIERMTEAGYFVDDGPSSSGRWRVLTPAGRALLKENGDG